MEKYFDLKNKVVLITGGTQGIGEAMARAFSEEGSKVVINGRILNDKVKRVLSETGATAVIGDISEKNIPEKIVQETVSKLNTIDVLVCNAAGMSMSPFLERNHDEWWDQININLSGHLSCIREALKVMKKNKTGTIIIISSFFGTLGWNNATGYGSSKSGLLTMGQYVSRKFKNYGIKVCTIVPGVIDTPQLNIDANDLGISLDEVRKMYAQDIAMKRIAQPKEIAEMAMFMATREGGKAFDGRHVIVSGGEYRSTPYYL